MGSRVGPDVFGEELHPLPLAGIELFFIGRPALSNNIISSADICLCLMSLLLQHMGNILSALAKRNTHLGV